MAQAKASTASARIRCCIAPSPHPDDGMGIGALVERRMMQMH